MGIITTGSAPQALQAAPAVSALPTITPAADPLKQAANRGQAQRLAPTVKVVHHGVGGAAHHSGNPLAHHR